MQSIKSLILTILILPAFFAQSAEERITIYSSDGYEKELIIDVPARFASRANEYIKAYTILYMEWWNRGVGTTARNALKYHFDPDHFNENTSPRRISADVGRAAESHFSKNDFWEKVALEGANFIEEINHKANSVEIDTIDIKLLTNSRDRAGPISVKIPKKFSRRAEEYRNEYALSYINLWNSVLDEEDPKIPLSYKIMLDNYRDFMQSRTGISIGGDIKNEIRKLFSTPEMREKVRKDFVDYLKNTKYFERYGHKETREGIRKGIEAYLSRKSREGSL